jgi:hypothetical protein
LKMKRNFLNHETEEITAKPLTHSQLRMHR